MTLFKDLITLGEVHEHVNASLIGAGGASKLYMCLIINFCNETTWTQSRSSSGNHMTPYWFWDIIKGSRGYVDVTRQRQLHQSDQLAPTDSLQGKDGDASSSESGRHGPQADEDRAVHGCREVRHVFPTGICRRSFRNAT